MKCSRLLVIIVFFTKFAIAADRPYETNANIYFEKLVNKQYEELESDWSRFKDGKEKMSDGQPMIAAFYGGVSGCVFLSCKSKSTDELEIRRSRLEDWKNRFPKSVAANISAAFYFVEYGWTIRGGDYAHKVSKDRFTVFRENVEIARIELEKLDFNAKSDVGWYFAMLEVAISQGWSQKDFDKLYYQAIEKNKEFLPFYFIKSAYMAPQWYGSVDQIKLFIDESVNRTKDTLGDELYARINWSSWSGNMFSNGQADWPRMNSAFKNLIKKYPDAWNVNNYAKFSCIAQDFNTFKELDKIINGRPISAAWFDDPKYYWNCKNVSSSIN
jgi:hypothetical protein